MFTQLSTFKIKKYINEIKQHGVKDYKYNTNNFGF